MPPNDYVDLLREVVMPVAPQGMSQVHLADSTATSANDAAISVALMTYAMKHKRDYKNLSVMGLSGASHGSSIATLSCSDPAFNTANAPTYNWPLAPLPQLKYPFAQNTVHNEAEEKRCLEAAEKIIQDKRSEGKDVGAIIVEPISGLANRQASPVYYKKLRQMAAREGIPFIVDESEIGIGSSGKMWSHEHWYLNANDGGCADIMTFGGNTGISGFYSTVDYRVDPQCCAFEQDVDMVKLINFGNIWKEI